MAYVEMIGFRCPMYSKIFPGMVLGFWLPMLTSTAAPASSSSILSLGCWPIGFTLPPLFSTYSSKTDGSLHSPATMKSMPHCAHTRLMSSSVGRGSLRGNGMFPAKSAYDPSLAADV